MLFSDESKFNIFVSDGKKLCPKPNTSLQIEN